MPPKKMYQQVWLLASAQALFQIVSVMVMTIGALAGAQMASSPTLATLPIAGMFLGTATMMFPASLWMAKIGRRNGFLVGALLGIIGGLIAAYGIVIQSLYVLSFGTILIGGYQAFAQFYRFAASEVADNLYRPKAISLVMTGGVVAALLGPLLARSGASFFDAQYLGTFLLLAVISLGAIAVLCKLDIPMAEPKTVVHAPISTRSWKTLVLQPTYLVAVFIGMTSYGVMVLAMTAMPIAMMSHQHSLGATTTVMQLHVLSMFLPSFITGSLITRFGVLKIMFAGIAMFIGHILFALSGVSFASFASALILLGTGWNFMYISGTALLTSTYTPEEKAKAQATNDMSIFMVSLACSLAAGGLLNYLGWQTLNIMLLPWLACAVLAIVWLIYIQRKTARIN